MLYKFKSKATADLIMLEPNGRQILRIIGKEPATKGILEVLEMPRAIEALRQAVQQEEDTRAQLDAQNVNGSVDTKETITMEDGVEYPLFKVEISSKSHPFFTGQNMLIDTAGRIDKFQKRYGKK